MTETWTIRRILKVSSEYLAQKQIESPRLSAEILLAHQLKIKRIDLYLDLERPLNENELSGYRSLIRRRINREPIQYITGTQEFWSLEFKVTPDVMIPRPESELLVEETISLLKHSGIDNDDQIEVLDIGTGSGALCISIAKEVDGIKLYATDISEKALQVAKENATYHGVLEKISFIRGDLFSPFKESGRRFQIILSNPPYIPSDSIPNLQPEVRYHEPRLALDGGKEGMEIIERIIMNAHKHLCSDGWLLIEMDPLQIEKAQYLLDSTGMFINYRIKKDFNSHDRMLMVQRI